MPTPSARRTFSNSGLNGRGKNISTVRNKSIRFFGRLSEVKSLAQRVVCLSSSVVIVCNVCIVAKRYVLPVKLSNQLNFVQQGVNKRQL